MKNLLSVVLPAYNEAETILRAASAIAAVLQQADILYELIFIDDGSKDDTWNQICMAHAQNPLVRGVRFSKNFGKESAIFAGLESAKGDCCAVMDCDLQHPPEKLVEMYRLWQQGAQVVEGVKMSRGNESAAYSFGARCFYELISKSIGFDMTKASDFKLLDRKAVDVLRTMGEKHVFFRGLSSWVGFETAQVPFDVKPREAGTTKWSSWSLVKYAVRNITSFSSLPLHLITILGVLVLLLSVVLGGIALYQKAAGIAQDGFTTVIVVLLFIGSVIMISLGCIGYYIAKIYEEIKGRPRYIVADTCGE